MICPKCGTEIGEGSKFCPECGAALGTDNKAVDPQPESTMEIETGTPEPEAPKKKRKPSADRMMKQGEKISDNIVYCGDGKYRWVYELSLFKNPTVFILIWKIFFFIFVGAFAITLIIDLAGGDFSADVFLNALKVYGIILGGMTALVLVSYLIYAAIMGGKYCVMFEMDEKEINHKQMPKQAKKAQILAGLTVLAGASSGSLTTMGVGMNSARTEMTSVFENVRKVKCYPRRHLIKVNQILAHNQVYCEKEDFEFVSSFIIERCPKLKNKKK